MNKRTSPSTLSLLASILLILLMVTKVQAQAPPPPPVNVMLIPYNDRGDWGYCDTLGNLVYKPSFKEASFFYSSTLGDQRVQMANVTTKWGENRLMATGKLLLPKKLDYQRGFYTTTDPNTTFLVIKKGKYGVYDLNEGMILPAKYDSLCAKCEYSSWVLLKKEGEDAYRRYNPETRELEEQQYVKLGRYLHRYSSFDIATTTDGLHYRLKEGELLQVTDEVLATYTNDENTFMDVAADWDGASSYRWRGPKPSAEDMKVDRILELKDYSRLSYIDKYGFKRIIIAELDGQVGILNEKGEEILPFQYDKITLEDSETQVILEKDGKLGRKLLFTIYPTIEPRYDKLYERARLRANAYWSFAVYYVELDGQKGYVGENGVEYFRWE